MMKKKAKGYTAEECDLIVKFAVIYDYFTDQAAKACSELSNKPIKELSSLPAFGFILSIASTMDLETRKIFAKRVLDCPQEWIDAYYADKEEIRRAYNAMLDDAADEVMH